MTTDLALPFERKLLGADDLHSRVARLPRPLIFTNGVFDVLHLGHVTILAQARALGASLVVGLNTDASVRRLGKGGDRPVNAEADRLVLIAALESVDLVALFDEDTPYRMIETIRPDVIVKGGDYDMDTLEEARLVRSWGGSAVAVPFVHARSTTATLARIRAGESQGESKR
ncbi:MAG: D-glycero-beta-D-manno-heptose 1-phosphate adenylyltransferase [Burkholderiaceae bacterium]